ncbi:MAG: DNA primase [Phycisphaeraceae bacterium]|nr:DNA primase [Phycisphaeraceae bacterium]
MTTTTRTAAFNDDKRRVLEATDIVRLIGEQLALRAKGRELVGLCPFHNDHKPSMCVVPHKQIYHCFSCGAGGDALRFVMDYHKMSFREALQHLADRAGIKLTPWRPSHAAQDGGGDEEQTPRSAMLGANQTACDFFRAILKHEEHGRAAREIIEKRGIAPEMVEAFALGASPDKWDGLLLTAQKKGLDLASFRAAGLFKARDGGGVYDAFRHRLMFPIHDQIGRVVGFGGRKIREEDDPKYLNSAESAVFDKGTTLYALHQAAQAIRTSRRAVVVEGYMDAIACHQAGVKNAVATLGTALTIGNARVLRRLCDTVVLLFDGDEAGMKAAERAVEVFFAEPIDVRIATLAPHTDAKDPDDLLKRDGGREVLERVFAAAADPLDLLFARVRSATQGQGLAARSRTIDEFTTRLVSLGLSTVEPVRYQLIVRRIAEVAGVDWQTIAQSLSQKLARHRVRPVAEGDAAAATGQVRLDAQAHLLACLMCDPDLWNRLKDEEWELLSPDAMAEGPVREVARAMADIRLHEEPTTLGAVLAALDDAEAQRMATRIATTVDHLTAGDPARLVAHFVERLREAMLQRTLRRPAPAVPADTGGESWMQAVLRQRELRAAVGHDPTRLPRPGG